jgi:hypothetical protein
MTRQDFNGEVLPDDPAEIRAREWLKRYAPAGPWQRSVKAQASLAALLREVGLEQSAGARRFLLAEVRRVVVELESKHDGADSWWFVREELLERLGDCTSSKWKDSL